MRTVTVCLVFMVQVTGPSAGRALMFDMGTRTSPLAEGYVLVHADTVYSTERGHGWDHPADRGFHSELEVKEKFRKWHPNHDGPLPNAILADGVTCAKPITFLIDVPDGRYSVLVTVGGLESPRHDQSVRINGRLISDNIDAWGSVWGSQGGSPTKTVKAIVEPDEGKIRIAFDYRPSSPESWREYTNQRPEDGRLWYLGQNACSIVAVRIRPWRRLPVWSDTGKLRTFITDCDQLVEAVARYNSGDMEGAYEAVKRIPVGEHAFAKACMLDWIVGDMSFHDADREEEILEESVSILERLILKHPNAAFLAERLEMDRRYLLAIRYLGMFAYSWAQELTGLNSYHRYWAAYDLCGPFTPDDPLYFKSHLVRGKVAYWNGREGGWKHCYALARDHFAILKESFPHDRLVRMYSGERVPSAKTYEMDAPGAPEWAVKQREALARISDLIRFWVEKRQSENGELGGGWGDDVEILREWSASVLAIDDPVARRGAEKIANGVWASGQIEHGYSKGIGDVEHAAEPVSDTQPLMVALHYGDPRYVERCMATMKCMREVWTGRSQLGHLHFRSHYFSATKVDDNAPRSADVALNGRAVKPGIWVAWYNNHSVVKSLLEDWAKAWVDDAMRTDGGKPAGIVPGSVSFPEDRIGGYAKEWWNTRSYFSNLASMGYTACLYQIMLAAYARSGNHTYLSPIQCALDAAYSQWKNPASNATVGSLPWVGQLHMSGKFTEVLDKWRLLSGNAKYDDYLRERGSAYLRYLLTSDVQPMVSRLQGIIDALSSNIEMSTSEVLFTDRVSMPGGELIFSMMTGGVGEATYYPLHAVTWDSTDDCLAALVEKAETRCLSILTYNFSAEEHTFGMRVWRLEPGEYELVISRERDAGAFRKESVVVPERGTRIPLSLLPHAFCKVELDQTKAFTRNSGLLPDLAVGPADISTEPSSLTAGLVARVSLTVHNIGTAPASKVRIQFLVNGRAFASVVVEALEAPLDLSPKVKKVTAEWIPKAGRHKLTAIVDPENAIAENVELNNTCSVEVVVP